MKNHCICCGAKLLKEPLIVCENMPKSAQKFPDENTVSQDLPITLELKQCSGCGLVQIDEEPVEYYRDVIRSGGYSVTMHKLRNEQYTRFLETCPIENKRIIEIGCGQGEFLRIWREDNFPVDAYGIENDEQLVEIALKDNLKVVRDFADAEGQKLEGAPFDGFCSFNFLEHQPDPNGMLRCIYNNLKDEAYGLITVPSLEYILEKESYYELIRDHLAYYSKDTFRFLLEKNGFEVLSFRLVNRDTWEAIVAKKRALNTEKLWKNKDSLKSEIDEMVSEISRNNKRLAVWGASHQGLTILSSMGLENDVEYIIDSAPFKQGKLAIGSHIPIVSPERLKTDTVDAVLIIAPGYTEEITELINGISEKITVYALRGNHLERL